MVNSSLIVSRLVTDEDRGCMKCSKNRINFEEKLPDSRLGGSGSCVNASRTCPWNSSTKTYGKFFCEEHEVDESTSVHQRYVMLQHFTRNCSVIMNRCINDCHLHNFVDYRKLLCTLRFVSGTPIQFWGRRYIGTSAFCGNVCPG